MAAAGRRRYRPPSNYARIIKVESHREHWRAVHSNCSLGIYTCGTPPALLEASTPFRPSIALSLFLSHSFSLVALNPWYSLPRTSLAVSLPFTAETMKRTTLFDPPPLRLSSRTFRSSAGNFLRIDFPVMYDSFLRSFISPCCKVHISIEMNFKYWISCNWIFSNFFFLLRKFVLWKVI